MYVISVQVLDLFGGSRTLGVSYGYGDSHQAFINETYESLASMDLVETRSKAKLALPLTRQGSEHLTIMV
jgi:hypothetical protein